MKKGIIVIAALLLIAAAPPVYNIAISQLKDVNLTGRTNGSVLTWNATTGKYDHGTASSGVSGLTATRIPYAASATALSDNANLTWDNASGSMILGAQSVVGRLNIKTASAGVGLFIRNTTDADIALLVNSASANEHILYGNGNAKFSATSGLTSVGNWSPAGVKLAVTGTAANPGGAFFKGFADSDIAFAVNNAASTANRHLFYSNGNATLSNGAGSVTIGTGGTGTLTLGTLNISAASTPTGTADATGLTGDIKWDADYIYVKTAAGWKRSALSTW